MFKKCDFINNLPNNKVKIKNYAAINRFVI